MDSVLHDATDADVGLASREYRRIELISGPVRRRHWSAEEKASLVAESFRPGINISGLARRAGVNRGLLQTWRRHATQEAGNAGATFIPIRVEEPVSGTGENGEPAVLPRALESSSPGRQDAGMIEIEAGDMHIRVHGSVDLEALRTVLAKLERRR